MADPRPLPPAHLPAAALLTLAAALPSLLAYNLTPSPTILNQCLAVALWGGALLMAGAAGRIGGGRDAWALLAALGALALAAAWSWGPGAWPTSLALSALLLLACAAVTVLAGATWGGRADAPSFAAYFYLGLLLAGVLGALIALVQVFRPEWADGTWIARSGLAHRAVGNLRQPNHLGSQLAWSLVALAALLELGRLRRATGWLLLPLLVGGMVLTGSRTGGIDMLLLTLWALLDRSLSKPTRVLLLAAPLLYAAGWFAMQAWNAAEGVASSGGRGDISSSRFGIWSNTLSLIAQQPWTGVGFGEFNLAWTFTPFPGRPIAFFDHTHNLPLQLAVELGLPLAALTLGLLGLALLQAWRRAAAAPAVQLHVARPALVMVLAILLHSLLEYPLWYAYFLLPAAFAWGLALARPAVVGDGIPPRAQAGARRAMLLPLAGALMIAGTGFTGMDYLRVVAIFAPPPGAAPLAQRIAHGQRSLLFAYHADYAALTTGEPADAAAQALARERAPHFLLDARLMMALSRSLAAQGQVDAARHVADRLREFRHASAEEFFAVCVAPSASSPASSSAADAFQCEPARDAHPWRTLAGP
jgi:Virulence factor membrane-bound polymerase, C-terminal/O-Antigen ligase/Protein glycosylation ligase